MAPGRTFFYLFELRNDGSEAVTVTGFNSNFVFQMHPDRQGDFALDHCKQFIEDVPGPDRQSFPVVIPENTGVTYAINGTNVAAPECSTPPTEPEIEEEPGATDGEESPGGPEDVDESATPSDPSVKDPLDTGNDQPGNQGDGKLVIDQTVGDTELAATGISENAMLWLAGSMVAGFTGAMLVLRPRKVRG